MFKTLKFLKKIFYIVIIFISNISYANINNKTTNIFCFNKTEYYPFYNKNQSGITTPQQSNLILASFDILAENKKDVKKLFILLTERIKFLMQGGKINYIQNINMPPKDSGILGDNVYPNSLTITVSLGYSFFDERFGFKSLKPKKLQKMHNFANDALDKKLCDGDLLLQICANDHDTVVHALRDIIKYSSGLLVIKWIENGFISNDSAFSKGKITPINFLGFKDGTANPDINNIKLMNKFIWVNYKKQKEPDWTHDGSYQVIRIIRLKVEFWDRTSFKEQQNIFGRDKYSGAPIGMENEYDLPNNKLNGIPYNAHVMLANPNFLTRKNNNIILRRGYNYFTGILKSGQLNMGLLFVCYQNDLEKGFIKIQNRLNKEPLEEYIKPIGGGYYFVLPGITNSHTYLGEKLIESTR